MKRTIRIDRLEAVYQANLNAAPEMFDMGSWARITPCGTTHCMVGNYIVANPDCGLNLYFRNGSREGALWPTIKGQPSHFLLVADHFGITETKALDLFQRPGWFGADGLHACLARLRQFIDLHKPSPDSASFDFKRESMLPAPQPAAVNVR